MDQDKPSALILLSGGMDSSVLLYYVIKVLNYTVVETIGFDYGQKHVKELDYAKEIAESVKIPFRIIKVDLVQFGGSPLTENKNVPDAKEDKQYTTVVPSRNAIFLSLASAYAGVHKLKDIFYAPNREDFKSYPDCRKDFVDAISRALNLGGGIRGVYAPFCEIDKLELVKIGKDLGVPFEKTWSCYRGGKQPCGECDACMERNKTFKELNL